MADNRFFKNDGPFSLGDIATLTGAELRHGNANTMIKDVAPLEHATGADVSFIDNIKYIDAFTRSRAGACFMHPKHSTKAPESMALLIIDEPYRAYALTVQKFYPVSHGEASISPQAHVSASATIAENTRIEPGAVIADHASIGKFSIIRANAVIGPAVQIGEHCVIGANSTLTHALVGNRVVIHRGVHIGQDGFGFALGREGHLKVPQLGRVIIEDDVEIGSGTCIDRGAGPDTIIGAGTKIDNLVQIGHNVVIGKHAVIVSQVGISGSTHIGDGAILAGQAGITGHLKIGAGVRIAAQSGVMTDIPAGAAYGGSPAQPMKDWHRQTIALRKLANVKGKKDE